MVETMHEQKEESTACAARRRFLAPRIQNPMRSS
jgi:hypothetical protein